MSPSDTREREGMWCVDQVPDERPLYTMDGNLAADYVKWLKDGGWLPRLQQFTTGEWLEISE